MGLISRLSGVKVMFSLGQYHRGIRAIKVWIGINVRVERIFGITVRDLVVPTLCFRGQGRLQ